MNLVVNNVEIYLKYNSLNANRRRLVDEFIDRLFDEELNEAEKGNYDC